MNDSTTDDTNWERIEREHALARRNERDETALRFLAHVRDDLAVIHRLSDPERPIDPERLQFVIWRARKALGAIEFVVDDLNGLYRRALELEAAKSDTEGGNAA